MLISPHDILKNGTKVKINGKRGCVVSHEIEQACPAGFIVVHSVELTEKTVFIGVHPKFKKMATPEIWKGSYRFINVVNQQKENTIC